MPFVPSQTGYLHKIYLQLGGKASASGGPPFVPSVVNYLREIYYLLGGGGGGSGGGLVTEAPTDGNLYGRKNAAWAAVPIAVDAPTNGTTYARQNALWTPAPPEAPTDGGTYARKNASWVIAPGAASATYAISAAAFTMPAYGSTVTVTLSTTAPGAWMIVNRYVQIDSCGVMQVAAYTGGATPSVTLKNVGYRGNALPGMSVPTSALIIPFIVPPFLDAHYVCDEFHHITGTGGTQVSTNKTVFGGPFNWILDGVLGGAGYSSTGAQTANPGSGILSGASLSIQSGTTTGYDLSIGLTGPLYARLRFRLPTSSPTFALGFMSNILTLSPQDGFWVTFDPTNNPQGALITMKAGVQTSSTPLGITLWAGSNLGAFTFALDGVNLSFFSESGSGPPALITTLSSVFTNLIRASGLFFSINVAAGQVGPDLFEMLVPGTMQNSVFNARYLFGP